MSQTRPSALPLPIPAVVHERRDGLHVYRREGETDYWDVVTRFLADAAPARRVDNAVKERDVYFLDHDGRRFVLKVDRGGWGFGGEGRFERFFWKFVRGPFYSRLMRRVVRARQNGCDAMQDIHLVAERRTLWYCHEAIVLLEFVDGQELGRTANPDAHVPAAIDCLASLHANGLAQCDVSRHNFLVTPEGKVKALDLVCRGNPRVDRVKDAIRMRKVFGVDIPVRGWLDQTLFFILTRFQRLRRRHRDWKKSRRPLTRRKNFRQ